jgi:acetolactate synthase-1/3 small subunit
MQHVISVTVEDKPGVLARVSSMFARRDFNIHSLAVGPTEDTGRSRMTVVVDGIDTEQIIKQLYKLVHTVKVTELELGDRIEREIMMVRVNAEPGRRAEILEAARLFGAEPVDVGVTSVTFVMSGEPARLGDFLELMRPYGITDLAKSGRIAMSKDPKSKDPKSKDTARATLRSA